MISGFNALTLSPALCALFLKPKQPAKFFIFRGFNRFFDKTNRGYTWVITHFMHRSVITFIVFLILSALAFWGFIKWPRTFLPEEDQGYFTVELELPEGATLERTREVTDRAITYLEKNPYIAYVQNVTGSSPRVGSNQARSELTVILKPWEDRKDTSIDEKSTGSPISSGVT